jgi:hypothetical protein
MPWSGKETEGQDLKRRPPHIRQVSPTGPRVGEHPKKFTVVISGPPKVTRTLVVLYQVSILLYPTLYTPFEGYDLH